jgi:CHAT domain-containing protein
METKALEAEKKSNWQEASTSYREASRAARISGQLQKALSYGNKAVEMAEKEGSPGLQTRGILQLSQTLGRLGQHAKRREWLQKGIEIAKLIPPGLFKEGIEANLYRELGGDFLRSGEAQKAVQYLLYSLRAQELRLTFLKSRRRGNPQRIQSTEHHVVNALERLGHAYQNAGNVEEAIKAYERGLVKIKESGLKTHLEAALYEGLGQLYLRQKDFPRAQESLQRALEMAEKLQHTKVIQHASSQIGDVFLQTQRPAEAIPYYKKAIDTIESTRSLLESEEFRTSFFEDKGQIYGGIILAHLGARNVEEAFNYNERARSRAFLDILGSKVELTRGETLLEEERALQARINALKAMMEEPGEEEDAADKGQLRQELGAAQKAYTDFLSKVRKEDKEQASLMNVEPLTLKQLQELLEPGVTVLEYFVLQGRAVLWVVEKDRVNFVRLSLNRSQLISKVAAIRDSIYQVGEKEKFKSLSQELYKVLIEPALANIQGKELLIIPHDVLHYLPYQALLSPEGKYLIQDYPIYYLSSASLMQFTREKRRASREKALVMGNPSLGDAAYDLRFAEREAKEVARLYPQSAVYVRSEATKSRAVSLSPNYDILHFAVHGELREDDPLNSGLLLAGDGKEDGRLRVGEIFSLNLKADTVVLSACESGLGKISSGDEIIGLTRSFIYAGTPSIVTTLWKVNDRTSYELMGEFYSQLKTGRKAEALRQAQLKTMKEFPEPFFWAAYGLTGEP